MAITILVNHISNSPICSVVLQEGVVYSMNESARKGKRLIIATIIVFLGFAFFDLTTSSLNFFSVGIFGVAVQLFRAVVYSILSYYLYKGLKWVRSLVGIILVLDSATYFFRIVESFISRIPVDIFIVCIGITFIIKFVSAILLLRSDDVRDFQSYSTANHEQ